jgi:hypothetical protein
LLSDIFSFQSSRTGEKPKLAIRQGLHGNWWKLVPHIATVRATAGVVQLSFPNVYWMNVQPPDKNISPGLSQSGALNFLQLTAKIHELLILTSISSIVLHIVQLHLTGQDGLPVGMVANAFDLGSAQFLRRESFWSSLLTIDPATGNRFHSKRF